MTYRDYCRDEVMEIKECPRDEADDDEFNVKITKHHVTAEPQAEKDGDVEIKPEGQYFYRSQADLPHFNELEPMEFQSGSFFEFQTVMQHIREKFQYFPNVLEEWEAFAEKVPKTNSVLEYVEDHGMHIPLKNELFGDSSFETTDRMDLARSSAAEETFVNTFSTSHVKWHDRGNPHEWIAQRRYEGETNQDIHERCVTERSKATVVRVAKRKQNAERRAQEEELAELAAQSKPQTKKKGKAPQPKKKQAAQPKDKRATDKVSRDHTDQVRDKESRKASDKVLGKRSRDEEDSVREKRPRASKEKPKNWGNNDDNDSSYDFDGDDDLSYSSDSDTSSEQDNTSVNLSTKYSNMLTSTDDETVDGWKIVRKQGQIKQFGNALLFKGKGFDVHCTKPATALFGSLEKGMVYDVVRKDSDPNNLYFKIYDTNKERKPPLNDKNKWMYIGCKELLKANPPIKWIGNIMGEVLVGRIVRKSFSIRQDNKSFNQEYWGEITAFNTSDNSYTVKFEDNDISNFTEAAILKMIR